MGCQINLDSSRYVIYWLLMVIQNKINQGNDDIILNAQKEKLKQKRYQEEIEKLRKEYDDTIIKDPVKYNEVRSRTFQSIQKVHKEVEFAILKISEKKFKLEEELEKMKEIMQKKN